MKKLIFILLLFPLNSFGQSQLINLKKEGNSIEKIIPNDWRILDVKYGDLNKDGINDMVFAIQNTDKANIEVHDGLGINSIDLNERILGIYFGTPAGSFRQELISNEFIIIRDSPTMDEPFDSFHINEKGILIINFHFWFSAGSWFMSNHAYKFRYQNNEFVLIGYDSAEIHRASGETTDYSINFLSKK